MAEESVVVELSCDGESTNQNLEVIVAHVMQEYLELWKQKQRSYGPHNIGDFGEMGCLIRANDKIQRLRRHYMGKNVSLDDESIEDTWLDLMGYALMGLVNERGLWPTR